MDILKTNVMKEKTKTSVIPWGSLLFVIAIVVFFVVTCQSCAISEEVTEAHSEDYKVAWCDYDVVYVWYNGKIKEKPNKDHQMYVVGDYLIEKDTFRYVGGIYP